MSACQDLPPDINEKARMSRAMDKMEAEQAQSDVARAVAKARAENEAAKATAGGIAQQEQARED